MRTLKFWTATLFLLTTAVVNSETCTYVYDMEAGKWVQQCNSHCNKPPKCEHVYDILEGKWKTVCVDQC